MSTPRPRCDRHGCELVAMVPGRDYVLETALPPFGWWECPATGRPLNPARVNQTLGQFRDRPAWGHLRRVHPWDCEPFLACDDPTVRPDWDHE